MDKMTLSELSYLINRVGTADPATLAQASGWHTKSVQLVIDADIWRTEIDFDQELSDVEKNAEVKQLNSYLTYVFSDEVDYYDYEREEGDPEELDFN